MHFGRSDLADFIYFLAIAKHRNFRLAGLEVGVSASALSHALKGLESRLGVRLINRTNRSVTLTAAGEELREVIAAPFDAIGQAVEALNRYRDAPTGRVRINVAVDAASLLIGPVLGTFVDRYPEVEVDVSVSNRMVDVTEGGFDAGVRYGGTVPEDMIAQRLSPDIRWVAVGSPAYLERYGEPRDPQDLAGHRCLQTRLGDDRIYKWDFERDGREVAVTVPGTITIDQAEVGIAAVLAGAGLMYVPEPLVAPQLAAGTLRVALPDWAPMGAGFHVYYSSRRNLPSGLRLLIDLIREMKPLG